MGIFKKEPAQIESFEPETVVSVDVNGLLAEAERRGGEEDAGEEEKKGGKKALLKNVSRGTNGQFLSAPGQVIDISPGVSLPAALPVAAAGSALRKPKNWGRKKEPERELSMFKYYVSLGDERCHAKVAAKYKMSSSNVNMIACDWSWAERIGILEAEQALIANATRTDDISDALRAAGIGVAREILKKIVIDKTTGMITGVEGISISGKGGLSAALRLVSEIREWLGEGGVPGARGRGPGGSKGGGMLGRPVLNFIIKK